jgi:hypothetical protein
LKTTFAVVFFKSVSHSLQIQLARHLLTMVEPDIGEEVERGNPALFGGNWSPDWCNSRP